MTYTHLFTPEDTMNELGIDWDALTQEPPRDTTRNDACGLPQWRIDPETGQEYYAPWRCDDYRHCEKGCREKRATEEIEKLTVFFASSTIFVKEIAETEYKKLTRQMRDNNQYYCRIPQPNGKVILLYNLPRDEETGLRPDGDRAINSLPFASWLKKVPEKKRIVKGGKPNVAGVKKDEETTEEYQDFDSFGLHCNASVDEIKDAFKEASYETPLPQHWLEIPEAINQKLTIAKKILESKGYVTYGVYLRIRIKVGLVPKWINPLFRRE